MAAAPWALIVIHIIIFGALIEVHGFTFFVIHPDNAVQDQPGVGVIHFAVPVYVLRPPPDVGFAAVEIVSRIFGHIVAEDHGLQRSANSGFLKIQEAMMGVGLVASDVVAIVGT
jgi:hypothetical protein